MPENANDLFARASARQLTRRSVVHAAAWATPVIAVAVAVPMAAASVTQITLEQPRLTPFARDPEASLPAVEAAIDPRVRITNYSDTDWPLTAMTATYTMAGPIYTNVRQITYPPPHRENAMIGTVRSGDSIWEITAGEYDRVIVELLNPPMVPAGGTVTIYAPEFRFYGTLTDEAYLDDPNNRIRATLIYSIKGPSINLTSSATTTYRL